jgi:hypothetical protein
VIADARRDSPRAPTSPSGREEVFGYFRRRARPRRAGRYGCIAGTSSSATATRIAALVDGRAVIGGVEHGWSTVGLYDTVDCCIARCWLLALDQQAFDAICSGCARSLPAEWPLSYFDTRRTEVHE